MSRFDRQMLLPGFGEAGQQKLRNARVLVVGAGGLGCPALQYLAAAGVGHIGIADGDSVSESNLNRQIIFGRNDVGKCKATVAAEKISEQYGDVFLEALPFFLTTENALETIAQYDLVLDGSDNFPTRYLVNDACAILRKPLVLGAIYQYEGQVMVLHDGENSCNYRDLYPNEPMAHEIPNCHETGVLGVLPGIIGTMQAAEAIKILSGIDSSLRNKVLFYNLLQQSFFEMALRPNPSASANIPANDAEFKQKNYAQSCGAIGSISWEKALAYALLPNSALIDIRELEEMPKWSGENCISMPLSQWRNDDAVLQQAEILLLFCQTGVRSVKKAQELHLFFPKKQVYSVVGGLGGV